MDNKLSPVVKWVGGKRQLLDTLQPLFPQSFGTYCEPFLGGGAVLFYLQPQVAIVNDANEELINVYNVIKNNWLDYKSRGKSIKLMTLIEFFNWFNNEVKQQAQL